ncbi:serine/threonine-protein kinase [Actinoplanes sp. NPDC049548]|uniref:serine/threonine protein kinase n=1 Tax=Actinoplanes sp. NPDC049548 TaxID=3155152 RepID=UPI0034496C4C
MSKPLRPGDPQQLGEYELLERLGEGGMGSVFLARRPDGRLVAVKVIRPEFAYEDEFRARFRSEVNRARQVPPFCTAEVLDADPEHPTPFLVVEYVDGPSLAEVVQEQGPLTAGNLHSVAIGVATAIAAIHGAGVIHRDLKPRNVLFSLGTPKVIDFGIARALEVTSQHTRTDQMVGTVAYMAPERFDSDSRTTGPAADVFAWGAVVTYAGTGRTPFAADSPAATAARILTQPPELSGLPAPLRDLVALTLAKDPVERPTAHELLDMLLAAGPQETMTLAQRPELRHAAEAVQHSRRHSAGDRQPRRRTRTLTDVPRPRRRRRLATLIAGGAAATVLSLLGMHYLTSGSTPDTTAVAQLSVAPPAPRQVRGPSVIDPLDRPGQWQSVTDDSSGSCVFTADGLRMRTGESSEHQCPGPEDTFAGDQTIAADVTVVDPGSCALVWFRYTGRSGYLLSACPGLVRMDLVDDNDEVTLTRVVTQEFRPGARHRLRIDLRGQVATVTIGDAPVFQAPVTDKSLVAGKVVFGVSSDPEQGRGTVLFAGAEIRSL